MADAICAASCWEPVRCEHGRDMTPRGRSVPMATPNLCDCYQDPAKNQRHLWHEHDDARFYSDPVAWAEHEASCAQCNR